jgi:hypothetical protein
VIEQVTFLAETFAHFPPVAKVIAIVKFEPYVIRTRSIFEPGLSCKTLRTPPGPPNLDLRLTFVFRLLTALESCAL